MTYFYDAEDLPEVTKNEDGTYSVDGYPRRFANISVNTEEHIKDNIDARLALLHYIQAENDAAEEKSELDELLDSFGVLLARLVDYGVRSVLDV